MASSVQRRGVRQAGGSGTERETDSPSKASDDGGDDAGDEAGARRAPGATPGSWTDALMHAIGRPSVSPRAVEGSTSDSAEHECCTLTSSYASSTGTAADSTIASMSRDDRCGVRPSVRLCMTIGCLNP
jgi:hypothetical protein